MESLSVVLVLDSVAIKLVFPDRFSDVVRKCEISSATGERMQ
jgi:hypothetical protein